MTQAIEEIASDRANLTEMGELQRRYVQQHYSLAGAIDRYDQILSAAVGAAQ